MPQIDETFNQYMRGEIEEAALSPAGRQALEEYLVGYWADMDALCSAPK